MKTLLEKTLEKIEKLEDKAISESPDIFSLFNSSQSTFGGVGGIRVDVTIDEDIEEDSSDTIAEGGEDTVLGQGSNPKPEDETYLSLLKHSAPKPKKIIIKN